MGRLLRRLERLQENSETTSSSESDDDRRSKNEWIRMSTPVAKEHMNTPPRKGRMILEESIATLEDYWYLDEVFADKSLTKAVINQEDIESPVFLSPPERLNNPQLPGHTQLDLTNVN